MEKTITITLTLNDNPNLSEIENTIKQFDYYTETLGLGIEYETNVEELNGTLPKPRRPKTIN